ncbi:ATP-dependent 6-phosphofructokinase [Actinidia chinensis var. chinensis]|uniref:ATP-dependent 6-phosphofructokinase n=1 Tax=Actinidia chinensis var. chinensis TaxID=1590841 RepID=A0A2R6PLT5_ACTCC|nr:ATP-dependent 6-phosphofructokinase [Actinidia chinensis var. chinensis]
MDLSLSRNHAPLYHYKASSLPNSRYLIRPPLSDFPNQDLKPRISLRKSLLSRHSNPIRARNPDRTIDDGFFIEDVPHLTNFLPNLPGGYRGFYSKNTTQLTPKVVNDIHKRSGTFLQASRGGHDTNKTVDNIQDREVYIIGGDGTQKGAAAIYKVSGDRQIFWF